jgi:hypothetical protein
MNNFWTDREKERKKERQNEKRKTSNIRNFSRTRDRGGSSSGTIMKGKKS